jgi:hypothetical protein
VELSPVERLDHLIRNMEPEIQGDGSTKQIIHMHDLIADVKRNQRQPILA